MTRKSYSLKKLVYYFVFLALSEFFSLSLNAQNLVLNPSFENTTGSCSGLTAGEGFSQVVNWDNANSNTPGDSCSSPDLFSPCNTLPIVGGPSPTFAPNSWLGHQCAKSGDRYAGIITNEMGSSLGQSYREYIQGKLSSPLQAGQKYCVSFYISLGDDVTFASNNIGVYFSNTHYLRDACAQGSLINVTPQLNYNCNVITDTAGWVRLQWDYVATGGESYFMIGNFYNDANTQINNSGVTSMNPYAYYFIDDVSVVPGPCDFAEITMPNASSCPQSTASTPSAPMASFCINDPAINLVAQTGINCSSPTSSGTWSGTGITNPTLGTFTPSVAGVGTHTITYTTQNGYVATAYVIVSNCTALSVCRESNGDLTVSGGTAPFSWQQQITTQDCSSCLLGCVAPPGCAVNVTSWSTFTTGTTIPAPTNLPVRVSDGAGMTQTITNVSTLTACNATGCPTITVSVSSQSNISCNGANNGSAVVSASGGASPYNYSWAPGNLTGATQSNLSQGTYTVTATDKNSCTGTVTVTITQPSAMSVTTNVTNGNCGTNNGSITASTSGGTAPYTYSWSNGGSGATINQLAVGSYTVTVTDSKGCQATAAGNVNTTSGLTVSTTVVSNEDCGQQNGAVNATVSGGTAPYTYSWSNGASTQNITGLTAGNYSIVVTDANSCSATSNSIITSNSTLTVSVSVAQHETCNQHNGAVTSTVSGGTAPLSYSWSNGATSATIQNLDNGTYSLTVTDADGCSVSSNSVQVNDQASFSIQNQTIQPTCTTPTGSITITPNGGISPFTYQWSNGAATSSVSNLAPGNYSVIVTDNSGCGISQNFTINAVPVIEFGVNVTSTNCGLSDGAATVEIITGTGPFSYLFTPGNQTTPTVEELAAGNYAVTVSNAQGCSLTKNFTIQSGNNLLTDITSSNDLLEDGETSILMATTNPPNVTATYNWTPSSTLSCNDCPNPIASPTVNTWYYVTVITDNGCIGKDSVLVRMKKKCGEIYVPSIFSPNGDGNNDIFTARGACIAKGIVTIYNRWGEVVFKTDDIYEGWDGTQRQKEANTGVYIYRIEAVLEDETTHEFNGSVTLVR